MVIKMVDSKTATYIERLNWLLKQVELHRKENHSFARLKRCNALETAVEVRLDNIALQQIETCN